VANDDWPLKPAMLRYTLLNVSCTASSASVTLPRMFIATLFSRAPWAVRSCSKAARSPARQASASCRSSTPVRAPRGSSLVGVTGSPRSSGSRKRTISDGRCQVNVFTSRKSSPRLVASYRSFLTLIDARARRKVRGEKSRNQKTEASVARTCSARSAVLDLSSENPEFLTPRGKEGRAGFEALRRV